MHEHIPSDHGGAKTVVLNKIDEASGMNYCISSGRRTPIERYVQRHGLLLATWFLVLQELLARSPEQSGSTPCTPMISQFDLKIQTL